MKLEAYDIESLRKLVRDLQDENRTLRELLKKENIPQPETDVFENVPKESGEYDPDQGARINRVFINDDMARDFFRYFWGRTDVYAKRSGKGYYFPRCLNFWKEGICRKRTDSKYDCSKCEYRVWEKVGIDVLKKHLYSDRDTDVMGIYPLFPDGTCRLLVFDFDNHSEEEADNNAWKDEVNALRLVCMKNHIDVLVERSRSGRGAHLWIFFDRPIPATRAREFGRALLDRGYDTINMKSFAYYDRMFPTQDSAGSLGNLIALPLQGKALKEGNSAFVDEDWNAYPDQWAKLFSVHKLSLDELEKLMIEWQGTCSSYGGMVIERPAPWKRNEPFRKEDVNGQMHIVLADGVYVDTLNLQPRLQNQIKALAAFDNPQFYKNKNANRSNYATASIVYLGEELDGYIRLPFGMLDTLMEKCSETGLAYEIQDHREKGRPIRVSFKGELRDYQDLPTRQLLSYETGVLHAATAFGKTPVAAYLIAQRKVSTLILIHSDMIDHWVEELHKFLQIDEPLPKYKTKTGREKTRDDVIGTLSAGSNKMTGIVDVAMVGTIVNDKKYGDLLSGYGMVIVDECHHAASATDQKVLKRVRSKYLYGLSASDKRSDSLEKIIYMLLGPVRSKYTSKELAESQSFDHLVCPRFTSVVWTRGEEGNLHQFYELVRDSSVRNQMIVEDVQQCVEKGRTPVILTRFKDHARQLYDALLSSADHVYLVYGDNKPAENEALIKEMNQVPANESLVLIATGQKIGEGFNFPRLNTLMLASPVSGIQVLEQYVGRLNRNYEGKENVIVYDYVDSHIPMFDNMYRKRLRGYGKLGYSVLSSSIAEKQQVGSIFNLYDYQDVFERDLVEADREIIVASPSLTGQKIDRFLYILRQRMAEGVRITVVTQDPDLSLAEDSTYQFYLYDKLRQNGVDVKVTDTSGEHYAVIDQNIVWHGGMNLLGKEDNWNNMIRVEDRKAAAELLEMTFADKKPETAQAQD